MFLATHPNPPDNRLKVSLNDTFYLFSTKESSWTWGSPPGSSRTFSKELLIDAWRGCWTTGHRKALHNTLCLKQTLDFFCHKCSDHVKNFVRPLGQFWDVSHLFLLGIFGDNVTFSAQGAPRKSCGTYCQAQVQAPRTKMNLIKIYNLHTQSN